MMNDTATRITLIDDDEADVFIFRRAMRNAAIETEIEVYPDGQTFLDDFARRKEKGAATHHVVLMDINMPRMSGFEALRALQELGWRRSPPVVMFSTSRDRRDVDLAYSLGVSGFVAKPSTLEEAEALVKALSAYWLEANIR